jgi:succinoglycan biosynthesis transport protein ExoP
MNPSLFFLVLRARFGLFALAVCATLISAAVVTLLMPKSYRATASLVIDHNQSQSLREGATTYMSNAERTSYLQTQVEILRSPKVARRVVDNQKLAEVPELRAEYEAQSNRDLPIEEWIANRLASSLDVETSQSSVLHVSANAPDPTIAAATANGFAQAYMDTTLELRVAPTRQAAEWFDDQLKTLRQDLEAAQEKLTAYQQEHGIVTTSEGADEEFVMLTNLSDQLGRTMEQNIELATREQLARRAVETGSSLEALPSMRDDDGIQQLRAELREGEAKLQALSVKFGENHPDYRRQRAENQYLRSALATEMQKVAGLATGRREEGEQRAARVSAALAAQRARLLEQKQSRDGLAVLMRNVNTAQTAYDAAMQGFIGNQVESRANQGNATLLNAAAVPRRPHSPNIALNLALAAIVGLVLGIGLVMAREMTDRRVHSPLELAEATGAPVLGELLAWTPSGRLALAAPRNTLRSITHRRQDNP